MNIGPMALSKVNCPAYYTHDGQNRELRYVHNKITKCLNSPFYGCFFKTARIKAYNNSKSLRKSNDIIDVLYQYKTK